MAIRIAKGLLLHLVAIFNLGESNPRQIVSTATRIPGNKTKIPNTTEHTKTDTKHHQTSDTKYECSQHELRYQIK